MAFDTLNMNVLNLESHRFYIVYRYLNSWQRLTIRIKITIPVCSSSIFHDFHKEWHRNKAQYK